MYFFESNLLIMSFLVFIFELLRHKKSDFYEVAFFMPKMLLHFVIRHLQ